MRAFILAFALALPLTLTACQSEQADAVEDAYDAEAADLDAQADVLEDQADAVEEAGDDAADAVDEAIEEGAPAGDMEDVIGDGEIIDEPGEADTNELGS